MISWYVIAEKNHRFENNETDRRSQTDNIGFGGDMRRQGNKDVLENKKTFRDSFREMMDSVTRPFPQCVDYLVENIKLDPYFNEYFQWALQHNIPTVVLSSGMRPVIKGILEKLVGPDADKIDIVCNEAVAREGKTMDEEGGWRIEYHDDRLVDSELR
jgi:2-hydroxy-3-keto-5-methylthiopentenyl-1-phosphate phosphatase